MPSSHHAPPPCHWFSALAAALDSRSGPRLAWFLVGAILARGRRTVTSWILAAGLSEEYRSCYTTVAAADELADAVAVRLPHGVVKPLVAGAARLTLALDDTPNEWYGWHVQGAGVHHNQTPGPASSPFVYGHVWVVLGLLVAHRREDYLTVLCPTCYRPGAKAERYAKFLAEIFPDAPAVSTYLRAFAGYALTGLTKDQAAYFCAGDGSNGKSVFLEVIPFVMGGDYCYNVPAVVLMDGASDRHPTEIAGFRGARLAVVNETQEEGGLNEARLKALTGGDRISARVMRGNYFEFEPTHKLIIASNHLPRIRGTDAGVWRRPRVIEFKRMFWKESDKLRDPGRDYPPADKADPDLTDALKDEAEGILADMVSQAARFFKKPFRFDPPPEVHRATERYRKTENKAEQFLKSRIKRITTNNTNEWMTGKELRDLYVDWSTENGFTAAEQISTRKLGQCAKKMYAYKKTGGGVIHYQCMRFDSQSDDDEDQKREEPGQKGRVEPYNSAITNQTHSGASFDDASTHNDEVPSRRRTRPSNDTPSGGAKA